MHQLLFEIKILFNLVERKIKFYHVSILQTFTLIKDYF